MGTVYRNLGQLVAHGIVRRIGFGSTFDRYEANTPHQPPLRLRAVRDPHTNRQDPNTAWDFSSRCPEATHQFTWLFGDRGIPASYRHLDGFGSHTCQWVNPAASFAELRAQAVKALKAAKKQRGFEPGPRIAGAIPFRASLGFR